MAFAKYENETNNVVGGRQFRLPSFGGAIAPSMLPHQFCPDLPRVSPFAYLLFTLRIAASRTNPLFDAATLAAVFDTNDAETDDWIEIGGADDDSDIEENGGFDLAGRFSPPPTAEESYGFGFGQTLTETDILSGAKDEADLGYGFDVVIDDETEPTSPLSGPEADQGDSEVATDPDMLKQLQQQMDNALEALNTPTEIHERIAGILRISELLEKDPVCVQECIDMNGVLSLMSAMKEDSDETMQRVGMRALNTLADNDQALAEILQYHAVNFWGHALEVDSLWKDALVGLEKARRSEAAVHLMISENILHRLCDRLPFATVDEQSQIFAVFVAIATTAERLSKLNGMFDALQIAMGNSSNRKMLLDVALEVIEAATGSFGVEAISQINESGLSAALAAMPSSVLAENATLRRVLAYLEE